MTTTKAMAFEFCCWTFDLSAGPAALATLERTIADGGGLMLLDRLLLPSPQTSVWDAFLKEKHGSWERNELERLDLWVRAHRIRFPSVLRILGTSATHSLTELASWLQGVLQRTTLRIELRGFIDKPGIAIFPLILAPEPAQIAELADKFDKVHPVLLGPSHQILRLRAELSEAVTAFFDINGLAVVALDEQRVTEGQSLAESFLPPPSRANVAHAEGGVHIGEAVRYSRKEYLDLIDRGFAQPLGKGWTLHPIITQPYLELLGISEDDMLVELMQSTLATKLREEIDRNFADLECAIHRRILKAHFDTYSQYFDGAYLEALQRAIVRRYFTGGGLPLFPG